MSPTCDSNNVFADMIFLESLSDKHKHIVIVIYFSSYRSLHSDYIVFSHIIVSLWQEGEKCRRPLRPVIKIVNKVCNSNLHLPGIIN